jgi:hypothetical protein
MGVTASSRPCCHPSPPSNAADPKFAALRKDVGKEAGGGDEPSTGAGGSGRRRRVRRVPPADDKEAQGKAANAERMDAAQPKEFDKTAFVKAVQDAIAKRAPKNLDEADKFADSGKADEVKAGGAGKVGEGKDASARGDRRPRPRRHRTPPAVEKRVVPLAPDKAAGCSGHARPAKAVPDPLPASATDTSAGPPRSTGRWPTRRSPSRS